MLFDFHGLRTTPRNFLWGWIAF